jgi:hypothetical protein
MKLAWIKMKEQQKGKRDKNKFDNEVHQKFWANSRGPLLNFNPLLLMMWSIFLFFVTSKMDSNFHKNISLCYFQSVDLSSAFLMLLLHLKKTQKHIWLGFLETFPPPQGYVGTCYPSFNNAWLGFSETCPPTPRLCRNLLPIFQQQHSTLVFRDVPSSLHAM